MGRAKKPRQGDRQPISASEPSHPGDKPDDSPLEPIGPAPAPPPKRPLLLALSVLLFLLWFALLVYTALFGG